MGQIKGVALVVFNGANKVNGVKVRTFLKHGLLFGVIHVNLRTFKYLQRNGAIGIVGQERTTAGFAHVAHHATHTHGAVELFAQINGEFSVLEHLRLGIFCKEFLLYKLQHLAQLVHGVFAAIELAQIGKHLLLQTYKHACQQLFVAHRVSLQSVGHHIVYVLDKHHVGVNVVQIFNQSAMSARTEQQVAVFGAEGRVVGIGSHRVGAWLLL